MNGNLRKHNRAPLYSKGQFFLKRYIRDIIRSNRQNENDLETAKFQNIAKLVLNEDLKKCKP